MFKGKVMFYKNIDGKEERIEQEFDDPRAYQEFISKHPEYRTEFRDFLPAPNWSQIGSFWNTLDDMIDRRMRFWIDEPEIRSSGMIASPEGINLDEYEEELEKIDAEKANLEASKKSLEEARNKLKEYIKRFQEAGRTEKVKQAEEDLKKVEAKLKNL